MYEIGHLAKFLEGHPDRIDLLSRASEAAGEDGLLISGFVKELLGADAEKQLGELVTSDLEYMLISVEAISSRC